MKHPRTEIRSRAIHLVWDDIDDVFYEKMSEICERARGQYLGSLTGGSFAPFDTLTDMLDSVPEAMSARTPVWRSHR